MSLRRPRKILSLACLLIYLAAGYGSAHAAVWCFGADGHVEYKLGLKAACSTPTTRTAGRGVDLCRSSPADSGCCGPCLDVPTSCAAPTVGGKRLESRRSPAVIPVVFQSQSFPRSIVGRAVSNRLSQPPPAASSPLSHLETVVLLN